MSTRANVTITDGQDTLWFYRHSDGYPSGALPTLQKFCNLVLDGDIRDNTSQAAGWLISIGQTEYSGMNTGHGVNWKVGAYEPTVGMHGDIEFLYNIDLEKKTISIIATGYNERNEKLEEYNFETFKGLTTDEFEQINNLARND